MNYHSPLRYPGGKRRLIDLIVRLIEENRLRDIEYLEPYAGGASIALYLLFNEFASTIHINDLSRPVFAFWRSVVDENDRFCERLKRTDVTLEEWHKQRDLYVQYADADLFELGFAAFFLNRTNRSGIIDGRPIGGLKQTGHWGIGARFNKRDLMDRIKRIGRYRTRIVVSCRDAAEFVKDMSGVARGKALFFIDPPYIDSGKDLYLNYYDIEDHRIVEQKVAELEHHWIVTYDHEGAIRNGLYADRRRLSYWLSYSAQGRRRGQEAMFLSDSLRIPADVRKLRPWATVS